MPLPVGRPTKFTPETRKAICDAVARGATRKIAAKAAGVSIPTFMAWMDQGRQGRDPEFSEFLEAVTRAEAQAAVEAAFAIQLGWQDDWRAAAWYLERRHPQEWGNKQQVNVNVTNTHVHAHAIIADPVAAQLACRLFERVATSQNQSGSVGVVCEPEVLATSASPEPAQPEAR